MSNAQPVGQPLVRPTVLRGSPERITDFMEHYQQGLVRSIAAASGVVVSEPGIDEGIDLVLTHTSAGHKMDRARLEVQLKATTGSATATGLSIQIAKSRYDYLRSANPAIPKILVAMSVPTSQDDWVKASDKRARLRRAMYWVNLEGMPASTAAKPTISVPFAQRFDDVVLCDMMTRIGQGGRP